MISNGLRSLDFQGGGAFVPEEFGFGSEARIDQSHGMPSGAAIHACAGDGSIAKAVFLLVARGAADGAVARKAFVVKEHATEGSTGIGDGVVYGRVRARDVNGFALIGVVVEFC